MGTVRRLWGHGEAQVAGEPMWRSRGPGTHTGLQLGVDVAQCVKGAVQEGGQGRVSHVLPDLECQGHLSLQGLGALLDLSKETGERTREGTGKARGDR